MEPKYNLSHQRCIDLIEDIDKDKVRIANKSFICMGWQNKNTKSNDGLFI